MITSKVLFKIQKESGINSYPRLYPHNPNETHICQQDECAAALLVRSRCHHACNRISNYWPSYCGGESDCILHMHRTAFMLQSLHHKFYRNPITVALPFSPLVNNPTTPWNCFQSICPIVFSNLARKAVFGTPVVVSSN